MAALFSFEKHLIERPETVGALIETRVPALERLLDHRAPDVIVLIPLLLECLESIRDGFERLRHGRTRNRLRCTLCLYGRTGSPGDALRLRLPHKVVVVQKLVAVIDEEIRTGILHAH